MQFKGIFLMFFFKYEIKKKKKIYIIMYSCYQIQENLYKMHGHLANWWFNSGNYTYIHDKDIATKYIHALYMKQ